MIKIEVDINIDLILEVTIARVLPHSQGIKGSMCKQFAE